MQLTKTQEQVLTQTAPILDEEELRACIKIALLANLASETLCQMYGPKNGCHCRGDVKRCHAYKIWDDEGRALVEAFERAGALK